MPLFTITNGRRNGRVVHTVHGPKLIPAGATVENVEMAEAEAANSAVAGVTVKGASPALPHDMTAAELLAQADGMHVKTLQSAAAKILGDATPSTKAEIIADIEKRAKADAAAKA